MFGMSGTELMIIGVIALILIGPDDLPKAARTIGRAWRDFQRSGPEDWVLPALLALILLSFAAGYAWRRPALY